MRRGTHETKIKAEMQADETRDRAEMRSLCRHNMAVLPTSSEGELRLGPFAVLRKLNHK